MDPAHLGRALRERHCRRVLRAYCAARCAVPRMRPTCGKPTDRPVDTSWMDVLYCAVSRRWRPSLARVPGW